MDVSVIIINYNTKVLTANCISSIIENTKDVNFEIIVVDNASLDGSIEFLKRHFPNVKYIILNENIGFGRACNKGLEIVTGKYTFLLNSDTIFKNDALRLFYDFYENNGLKFKIGTLGCWLIDSYGNINQSYDYFPTPMRIFKKVIIFYLSKVGLQVKNKKLIKTKDYACVDYIIGADLFIRTELVKKFKGFAPEFFMYYEETDLQYRLNSEGYRSYLISGPQIIHLEGQSGSKTSIETLKLMDKSLFIFLRKYYGKFSFFTFKYIYIILRLGILINKQRSFNDKTQYLLNLIIN